MDPEALAAVPGAPAVQAFPAEVVHREAGRENMATIFLKAKYSGQQVYKLPEKRTSSNKPSGNFPRHTLFQSIFNKFGIVRPETKNP